MKLINCVAEYEITVQRSRFHAIVMPATSMDDVREILATRKKTYRKARHHCWACRFLDCDEQLVEQARDDGEVGRPGLKLLELLRHHDLAGVIVVSRFFGGVKLGPAGVGRAFRDAGRGVIAQLGLD